MGSPDELKYKEFSNLLYSQQQVQLKKRNPLQEVQNQLENKLLCQSGEIPVIRSEKQVVKYEVYEEEGYKTEGSEGENLSNDDEEFKECLNTQLTTPQRQVEPFEASLSSELKRVKSFALPAQKTEEQSQAKPLNSFIPPPPPMCVIQRDSENLMLPPPKSAIPAPPPLHLVRHVTPTQKTANGKLV